MPAMPARPRARHLLRLLGARRPPTRGRLRLRGLESGVTIRRDRWGIPHVMASTEADAFFGLGVCHGQDRGWQLELLVRAGRGTVAELVGAPALPIDRLSRTLGFARLAAAQLPLLDADVRRTLEAYVAGVNAARAAGPRPHELALLRSRPTPWQATDVLAFMGLQAFALASNWDVELARLRILAADGPGALAAVDAAYPAWLPVASPVGATAGPPLRRLAEDLELLRGVVGAGTSNSWAIGGGLTASGAPLLANDPHLAPSVPAQWYLAHLEAQGLMVLGASFVGGPAFPTGFNGHAAWGITAGLSDSSDVFVEELSADGRSVRHGNAWRACEVRHEQIAVRGAAPHVEEVRVTPRGPLISPLLDDGRRALSLAATWLAPRPVRGLLDAPHATSFSSFRAPFAAWAGPSLNVTYADRDGHVGWLLVGTLPRRRRGNGTIPLPGWDPANGWDGEVPFDEMPCELDPAGGFVATANNAPRRDAAEEPYLGVDWIDGYRAQRIVEVVGGRDGWDVDASMALQVDTTSVPWRELRDLVLAAPPASAAARRGLDLLRAWDGRVDAGSAAATVYELLLSGLQARVAAAAAPTAWRSALGGGIGEILPRTLLVARSTGHLVRRLREEPMAEAVASVLGEVVERLEREHGTDPAAWSWGRLRTLTLRHAMGAARGLGGLNLGPVPLGGDVNTVPQAGVAPLDPLGNPSAIANHRAVIDLGDPSRSRFVIAGGQSGNPLSPNYDDLFALWLRGEGVAIPTDPDELAAATVATLRLEPR